MTPIDLMNWRRERKLTQAALGAKLGVSRNTINNWEAGRFLPGDLAVKLLALDPEPKGKALPLPRYVTPMTAPQLYKKVASGSWTWKPEHPVMLLGEACRDAEGKVLWEVLGSEEYQAALARYRSSARAKPDAMTDEAFDAWQQKKMERRL